MAVDREPTEVYKVVSVGEDGRLFSSSTSQEGWRVEYVQGRRIEPIYDSNSRLFAFRSLRRAISFARSNDQVWLAVGEDVKQAPERIPTMGWFWDGSEWVAPEDKVIKRFWRADRWGVTRLEWTGLVPLVYLDSRFSVDSSYGTVLCRAVTLQEQVT